MNHRLLATAAVLAAVVIVGFAVERETLAAPEDQGPMMTAFKAIGVPIHNKQDENLGKVENLIINTKEGTVPFVVVSTGGFLGLGERVIPVPLRALSESSSGKGLTLDLSRKDVKDAPRVHGNILDMLQSQDAREKLSKFYDLKEDIAEGNLKRVSELMGKPVMNHAGDTEIGRFMNIAFSCDSGKIRYAALSFKPMGMGGKMFAVPWDKLNFSKQGAQIRISLASEISKDKLQNFKSFSAGDWPSRASEDWQKESQSSGTSTQSPQN